MFCITLRYVQLLFCKFVWLNRFFLPRIRLRSGKLSQIPASKKLKWYTKYQIIPKKIPNILRSYGSVELLSNSAFLHSRTKNRTILIHKIPVHNKSLKATKLSTIKFSVLCFIINHNFSVTFMVLIPAVTVLYVLRSRAVWKYLLAIHMRFFILLHSAAISFLFLFIFFKKKIKMLLVYQDGYEKKNRWWTVPFTLFVLHSIIRPYIPQVNWISLQNEWTWPQTYECALTFHMAAHFSCGTSSIEIIETMRCMNARTFNILLRYAK